MVEPTPALDLVVEKAAPAGDEILDAIVAELLGTAADAVAGARLPRQRALAQWLRIIIARPSSSGWTTSNVHDPATIEHLAEHVFSLFIGRHPSPGQGGANGDSRSRQKT